MLPNPLTSRTLWSARADIFTCRLVFCNSCIFVPLHYWSILSIISFLRECHPEFHCTWYEDNKDYSDSDSFVLGMQNFTSWFRAASTLSDIIRGHGKRYFSGIFLAGVSNRNVNKKQTNVRQLKSEYGFLGICRAKNKPNVWPFCHLSNINFFRS